MISDIMTSNLLILGATGYVGSALAAAVPAARTSSRATGIAADLSTPAGIDALILGLEQQRAAGWLPDAVACCAGIAADQIRTADDMQRALCVQVAAPLRIAAWLAGLPISAKPRRLVLLCGLQPGQSLPMPPMFAAVQGAVGAAVMAMGHEYKGALCVSGLALGLLGGGAGARVSPEAQEAYRNFAAIRRLGTAEEVVPAIRWLLAGGVNGKVVGCNGGI